MNICLNDARFLGCFPQCEKIETGLLSQEIGTHTLSYYFLDGIQTDTFQVGVIGVQMLIPNIFNEFGVAVFRIIQPSGATYTDAGDDTFKLRITPNIHG